MAIKEGAIVRQKVTPIQGQIVGFDVDKTKLAEDPLNPVIVALVQWETHEGDEAVVHTRGFPLDQLEEVPPEE